MIASAALALGHGFHSSLATVDYVSSAHTLQTVLVVSAVDLENTLRARTGRQIELDRSPDAAALTASYVNSRIEFRRAGQAVPLRWVGMEVKTNFAYIYVEASLSAMDGLEIRNALLTDSLPDQVNMLTLRRDGAGKPFDCLFQRETGFVPVK